MGDLMALVTFTDIAGKGHVKYARELRASSASLVLNLQEQVSLDTTFDIFLSHSYQDVDLDANSVLDARAYLEGFGYSVYVDWDVDKHLSRDNVTPATAATLRTRMAKSKCLLYATSKNALSSKWMPWELGFKDGNTGSNGQLGTVAIFPLTRGNQNDFHGLEYLGIYPYIQVDHSTEGRLLLWVYKDANTYVSFDAWLVGHQPKKH
jgi:hypothetical protein